MLIISRDLDSFVHGEYDFFCDEDPSLAAVVPDVDVLYTPSHVRLRDFVSFSWYDMLNSGVPIFESMPITDNNFVVGAAWNRFIRSRVDVEMMIDQPVVEIDSGISTMSSEPLADGNSVNNAKKEKVQRLKSRKERKKNENSDMSKAIESHIVCSIFAAPVAPSNHPKKMPRLKRKQFKKVAAFGHL